MIDEVEGVVPSGEQIGQDTQTQGQLDNNYIYLMSIKSCLRKANLLQQGS